MTSVLPDGQTVKVSVLFVKSKEFGDKECIKIYNLLFRRIMASLQMVQSHRNYFLPKESKLIPQHKLEIWPGFVTSVNSYKENGLMLQCDVSSRVLRTETVADISQTIYLKCKATNTLGKFRDMLVKEIVGQVVITRYNNKSYRIDDIDFDKSPKDTFTNYDGRRIKYSDYYGTQYNIDIRDENQPLLIHIPKESKDAERRRTLDKIALIPELCYLTGLSDDMRSDYKVMREVGSITRVAPEARKQNLIKLIRNIKNNPEAEAHLTNWGLNLADEPIEIEGRVLNKDKLFFGNRNEVATSANFTREASTYAMLTTIPLKNWVIICEKFQIERVVSNFIQNLISHGGRLGMSIEAPRVVGIPSSRINDYVRALQQNINKDTQLATLIVTGQKGDLYSAIKKTCVRDNPVASQVIQTKTISNERSQKSIVSKIALQINCKIGGELWGTVSPYVSIFLFILFYL